MPNNYGYQNENDFVLLFDDKFLDELDSNSQNFLKDLFGDVIDSNEKIHAWKNKMVQKADIFIKYKNYAKGVSIKCGKGNSIHHENIQEFRRYLENLGIPYRTIDKYVSYHYGYKKDENGKTDFSVQLNSEEYKLLYQSELDIFNQAVNQTRIVVDMIDRFIIRGRNCDYDIDALICGTIEDYVWIKKYDIYDLILSKRSWEYTSPHISCLTIGPKNRNMEHNPKLSQGRFLVCIRWNFIKEMIIEFKKDLAKK